MSTANKLTYLNGTKQAIKQAINEDFEVIDDNTTFREYADEISSNNAKYKDLIPKETANATNTLDISNSSGLDKTLVTQYGNTYQEITTGKNLFNASIQAGTYKDTTYTVASDGKITQSSSDNSGWVEGQNRNFYLEAGTYTISCIGKGTEKRIQVRNLTDNVDLLQTQLETYTFTLNERKLLALKTWGDSSYPASYYVQIEKGSTATTYEPYTNGASPNPDYPQEIVNISGKSNVNVCGKNLCPNNFTNGVFNNSTGLIQGYDNNHISYKNYINVLPNTQYYINHNHNFNSTGSTSIFEYDKNKSYIKRIPFVNKNSTTFTTSDTTQYINIGIYDSGGASLSGFECQLEKGSTATDYEPYQEQSYEINLGKNLLDLQLSIMKSLNTSGTWSENVYTHNGLTLTINDDKTIKVNGTATAQETFLLENQQIKYPTGTYYLSGSINGGNNSYDIRMFNYDGTSAVAQCYTGAKEINVINNKQVYNMAIVVRSGQTLNNVVFYPMFSTSNDTNYSQYKHWSCDS